MEGMDSKSWMERLARDESELDDWCYEEDKKGRVHVQCDLTVAFISCQYFDLMFLCTVDFYRL